MQLTFVIISYNEKDYLEQAINSCLDQKLADYEIIIGDDGSSDGSIEIIKRYAEKYPGIIRYFVSDRTDICVKKLIASLRVSNIIKRALDMANGEYVVILSGDDYFYVTPFFENAILFLNQNSKYVAYVGGYEKVWEDRPPVKDYIRYPRKLYWTRKYVHLSTFVFRKSVYDNGAFLQRFCDDTGLQYSLAFSGEWKYEETIMFAYRQRSGSIMHKNNQLDHHIVELMMFQDILCKGFLYRESLAKFGYSIEFIWKNRDLLNDERYVKYIENSNEYDNNIIKKIAEFDSWNRIKQWQFYFWIKWSRVLGFYYRIKGYSFTAVHKVFNI